MLFNAISRPHAVPSVCCASYFALACFSTCHRVFSICTGPNTHSLTLTLTHCRAQPGPLTPDPLSLRYQTISLPSCLSLLCIAGHQCEISSGKSPKRRAEHTASCNPPLPSSSSLLFMSLVPQRD